MLTPTRLCLRRFPTASLRPSVNLPSQLHTLLETVRKACLPGLWSQGVKLARESAPLVESTSETEIVVRVRAPGHAVAPTVVLYPNDGEWACDCDGKVDPCAHVAAAVIAMTQARQHGNEIAPAPQTRARFS